MTPMKFYCGIDQGKNSSSICIINEEKKTVFQKSLNNKLKDFLDILAEYKKEDIECVVESSCYWYWLVDGLTEAGYKVKLAHTFGLSLISKAKVKTDRRDAKKLAVLLLGGFIPSAYACPKKIRSLRDLARHRQSLVEKRTKAYTELNLIMARNGIPLSRNAIKQLDSEKIGNYVDDICIQLQCQNSLDQIKLYDDQIQKVEDTILRQTKKVLPKSDPRKRLESLPGVGKVLSATIALEVGDIHRFDGRENFSSYCRVIPGIAQSGNVSRRGRGSRQGNPYLKNAFMQAAIAAVRAYKPIRTYFEKQLERHRAQGGKMICYNIIAHKLALAAYAMLKKETSYDPKKLFRDIA